MDDEKFPVANPIDQAINNQVNNLVGNKDTNLNTIVKMSMLHEIGQVKETEINDVLERIRSSNSLEQYFINQEYELTYDMSGNLVPVYTIINPDEPAPAAGDHETILSKPEAGEEETEKNGL
jgi:hypothetical protein